MRLGTDGEPADAILCEGDEDLDRLVRDGIVSSEQVKDYSGSLGIGDRVVRETLARFVVTWVELRRHGDERHFVFTTTASLRAPRTGVDVLGLWYDESRREDWIVGVREWVGQGGDEARSAAAVAWLDEQDSWNDLRAAIDWRFDAPGLEQTRGDVVRRLTDRGEPPGLRETLIDRLLARVLEASVEPRVRDRVLTALDRDELLRATEAELAAWAATPRAAQLRRTLDEEKALRPLLESARERLPENAPPSKYLTARYEVIPFQDRGREQEIAQLTEWSSSAERASVLLIHGAGGSGKTRLLIEWCRRLRHQGWHAGFLDRDVTEAKLDALLEGVVPRCLVLDYGETRPSIVATLLHRTNRLRTEGGPKVRVVLLARTAGEWWRQLRRDDESIDNLALSSPKPIELSPLIPEPDERPEYIAEVAAAYATAHGDRPPVATPMIEYTHPRYDRVLYLHFEALLRVLDGTSKETEDDDGQLFRVLDHERRAWWRAYREATGATSVPGHVRRAFDRGMAAITLTGGTESEIDAYSLLGIASPTLTSDPAAHLVDVLHRLYPAADGRFVAPLEPDLLGEELIRQVLDDNLSLLDRLFESVNEDKKYHTFIIIGRLLKDKQVSLELTRYIGTRLEEPTYLPLSLREVAVFALRRILTEPSQRAPASRQIEAMERARLLVNLGHNLSFLGRSEEAITATETAIGIYRALLDQEPGAVFPALAMSLNNLGFQLSELGYQLDALQPAQEAVEIYRQLILLRPDLFNPDFARSLNNLSRCLNAVGQLENALESSKEAVTIYRELARQRPEEYLPEVARSLKNLGVRQAALDQRDKAIDATQEAVHLYRQLTKSNPGIHEPDLAASLHNLGLWLNESGRHAVALDYMQQAIEILRLLTEERQEAFFPDLAKSLAGLGSVLHALGRTREALDSTKEALEHQRQLVKQRPQAFLADLARSLHNVALYLTSLDRSQEAVSAAQEAVRIFQEIAPTMPHTFQPELASSLHNLGACLRAIGRHQEALERISEAVDITRKLARLGTPSLSIQLAWEIHHLAGCLLECGRAEEALEAIQEGIRNCRRLAYEEEAGHLLPDVAQGLSTFGRLLRELERHEEALEVTAQALKLFRQFSRIEPEEYFFDLANNLNTYGTILNETGRGEEAVRTIKEAVTIFRRLAGGEHGSGNSNLAVSLHNLSTCLSELGRHAEATAHAKEAVTILEPTYREHREALGPTMLVLLKNYRLVCTRAGVAPQGDLVSRLETMLVKPTSRSLGGSE